MVGRWYDYWDLPIANVLDRSDIEQGASLEGDEDKLGNAPILTKLHGSISWFRSLDFPQSNEIIYFSQPGPKNKKTLTNIQGLTPFIVPPTLDKSHFLQHELLSVIWRRARDHISKAETLAVIGYSLPASDTYVGLLFAASLQPQTRVILVNNNRDTTFKQRCIEYFSPYNVQLDTAYLGIEDSVDRFINEELS